MIQEQFGTAFIAVSPLLAYLAWLSGRYGEDVAERFAMKWNKAMVTLGQ